jgi:hypothetical protein
MNSTQTREWTMTVDPEKLRELPYTLTDDQRRLLREGLAGGENLDVDGLISTLNSSENQETLKELAAAAPDAGAGNAGTGNAGTGDAGTTPPITEPPLTRW